LQTSKYSKASPFHIKPHTMTLSYLRDDCHKQAVTHIRESRRFKSIYTLQGKTRPSRHTFSTLSCVWCRIICISRGPHIATLHVVVNRIEQGHCSRGKGLPTPFQKAQIRPHMTNGSGVTFIGSWRRYQLWTNQTVWPILDFKSSSK
jgi:hypothetical protein